MHDALDETLVGRIPTGEAFRQRFGNPYAVIHRADVHMSLLEGAQATDRIEVLTSTHGAAHRAGRQRRHRARRQGRHAPRRRADRRRRREVGGAPPVRRRRGARVGPRGLPRGGRQEGLSRPTCSGTPPASGSARTATWCTTRCAAASSTTWSSPSTAASKEEWSVREGSREEVQSYFEGICAQGAPADRPAEGLEALGHRRPRADRPVDLRPRHAAGRRRAPDAAIPGAGRLHGDGRRGDAGRGAARARQRLRARPSTTTSARASRAPRASCCRRARWAASSTPRASSAWCATTCGRAARRSASTTRWSGSTAGTSRTAWPPERPRRPP